MPSSRMSQAGGNNTLALLMVLVTNVASVFTIPPLLSWLGDLGTDIHLNLEKIILNLVLTILVPLIVCVMSRWVDVD